MATSTRRSGTQGSLDITGSAQAEVAAEGGITPELVVKVADKVYALLLQELRIETERQRLPHRGPLDGQGGW